MAGTSDIKTPQAPLSRQPETVPYSCSNLLYRGLSSITLQVSALTGQLIFDHLTKIEALFSSV